MAARYWVGGTADWDATAGTKWATTSGGAGGAAVPTTADQVLFDAASGANIITIGSGYNPSILQLTMTGFTGTLAFGSQNITLGGNAATVYNQPATMTITGTPVINLTYAGSTGTRTIASNSAVTEANSVSFNISAGTDIIATSTLAAKNINFTGFAGTLTNTARTLYGNLIVSTGITLTAGTAGTTFAATSGTQQITTNGKTLDFPTTQNSPGATLQLQDNLTMGSTRTFTLTAGTLDLNNLALSPGLFNTNNSNVRTIAFGTGNITLTGNAATIWNLATSTNLTVTGTPVVNATYAGSTGTRQINGGGSATYSPSNPKIAFNITAGTDIFTLGGGNVYGNVNFTGFTGSYGFSASDPQLFGNLTFNAGMTGPSSATRSLIFNATSGTQTITTNGVTVNSGIIIQGGSVCVFVDALTMGATNTFTFTAGTVQLKNGVTSTVGVFAASGTKQKFLESTLASSQATLSQASGTVDALYLTIRDINATGGATWNAFVDQGNIDAGNNDGWDFGISPIVGGNEYTYQLRSFTQPRRF